jgi:DNA-binding CsgD family transcriptional regulator
LYGTSADEYITMHGQEHDAGMRISLAHDAITILELGLAGYEAGLTAGLQMCHDDPPDLGIHVLTDLVEAAVRSGNRGAARSALERLGERALGSGTRLARGLFARSRALLADDADAEDLYREALDLLDEPIGAAHRARTHLVYGEWLRRRRRRRDAREHLRAARDLFDELGFDAFARRARAELRASVERISQRTGVIADELTPQEAQVARLVAEGSSNREIAAQLFISPNTVEYHLRKVFRKVGVSSRTQLARALLDQAHDDAMAPGRGYPLKPSHVDHLAVRLPLAS